MTDSGVPVVLVGTLSTDVVDGSRLHLRPDTGRPASLALPEQWRLVSGEILDPDTAVVARLGDRVAVTGQWVTGLVSLRGPRRVLRVDTIRPAS